MTQVREEARGNLRTESTRQDINSSAATASTGRRIDEPMDMGLDEAGSGRNTLIPNQSSGGGGGGGALSLSPAFPRGEGLGDAIRGTTPGLNLERTEGHTPQSFNTHYEGGMMDFGDSGGGGDYGGGLGGGGDGGAREEKGGDSGRDSDDDNGGAREMKDGGGGGGAMEAKDGGGEREEYGEVPRWFPFAKIIVSSTSTSERKAVNVSLCKAVIAKAVWIECNKLVDTSIVGHVHMQTLASIQRLAAVSRALGPDDNGETTTINRYIENFSTLSFKARVKEATEKTRVPGPVTQGNMSAISGFIHGSGLLDVAIEVFSGLFRGYEAPPGTPLSCTYTDRSSRVFKIKTIDDRLERMPTCFYKV
jgi:hypothetical protein